MRAAHRAAEPCSSCRVLILATKGGRRDTFRAWMRTAATGALQCVALAAFSWGVIANQHITLDEVRDSYERIAADPTPEPLPRRVPLTTWERAEARAFPGALDHPDGSSRRAACGVCLRLDAQRFSSRAPGPVAPSDV
jgi:hypothetical protein